MYSEVMEVAQSLDGRMGRRGMDRDDIDDEAQERQLRIKMNADFHNFVKKVQDAVSSQKAHLTHTHVYQFFKQSFVIYDVFNILYDLLGARHGV